MSKANIIKDKEDYIPKEVSIPKLGFKEHL